MLNIAPLLQHGGYRRTDNMVLHMVAPQVVNNMSTDTSKTVDLCVSPLSCLHDEAVSIKVTGLLPNQDVTLQASMKDVRDVHFLSYAHYRADSDGQVDVEVMESLGGYYEGVFPMGLIGSLLPAPNEYKYTRFFKRDVEHPNLVTLSVHGGHLDAEALCSPDKAEPLTTVCHERHYMSPGVQRIPVRYGKVRGCLFLPPGQGPFPGIVDMFGTAGGLLEYRSAQLASRGFASLALAFFNYDDLPKTLEEFNIAYFEEAVEFLLKHDKVLDNGVGVIGTSKGGDLALSMAAFIPSVLACVVINGFCAPITVGLRVNDSVYPSLPFWSHETIRITDDKVLDVMHTVYNRKILEEYILPFERSQAAFLFLVGADDKNIKSEYLAQIGRHHLLKHNYENECEVVAYPGTGHLLEPPYSPHCSASFQHNLMMPMRWGGSAKYHTMGQEKAWEKMQDFLYYHLVDKMKIDSGISKSIYHLRSKL